MARRKSIVTASHLCMVIGVVLCFSAPAQGVSVDLIMNGGFETGSFAGWMAINNGIAELTPWTVGGAGGGWFGGRVPLSGGFDAYNGFDGDVGLEYELYQDVSTYAGSTIRVHFHEFIPEEFTGPANIEFDNISLVLRPIPEPSTILLALLGGLLGSAPLRRCR